MLELFRFLLHIPPSIHSHIYVSCNAIYCHLPFAVTSSTFHLFYPFYFHFILFPYSSDISLFVSFGAPSRPYLCDDAFTFYVQIILFEVLFVLIYLCLFRHHMVSHYFPLPFYIKLSLLSFALYLLYRYLVLATFPLPGRGSFAHSRQIATHETLRTRLSIPRADRDTESLSLRIFVPTFFCGRSYPMERPWKKESRPLGKKKRNK